MAAGDDIKDLSEEIKKAIAEVFSVSSYAQAFQDLTDSSSELNKSFTQNRSRIIEMSQSIADAIPGVQRLNGNISDVTQTISEIAMASNRNVIANTEQIEQMFAASEVLSSSVETLTTAFADVGYTFDRIPQVLEESINYIQSIGGNAREVMNMVVRETDQLNRFQFEGGVKGLTKMAAQAAMLRVDMSETFRLADEVLTPEGAINMASAFQRLGVAAGNLVDPFQLMNQSINDPSGLQTSLADVAKQFTYFDEKTKSFKISPQGVLTLREMERETRLSAGSLSKMGLAAAELDQRLSEVSIAGLKFDNEEDKQYLANIATMGEGGTYEVKLQDGTTKQLRELNQEEFDKLIKEQKTGPKTIEEIQRDQLNTSELMASDIRAIKDKLLFGLVSARPAQEGYEGVRRLADAFAGTASGKGIMDVSKVRQYPEKIYEDIKGLAKDIKDEKGFEVAIKNYFDKNKDFMGSISEDFQKGISTFVDKSYGKLTDKTLVERELKNLMSGLASPQVKAEEMILKNLKPGQSLIEGVAPQSSYMNMSKVEEKVNVKHSWDEIKLTVDVGDKLKDVDPKTMKYIFTEVFNEPKFKQYILDILESKSDKMKRSGAKY